jgi:hypothetical protein
MLSEGWESSGLAVVLKQVSSRVSARKLDLFNNWCLKVLRPYLKDPRSLAAARYAEEHVDLGWQDTEERTIILQAARAAVDDLTKWFKAAPTSAEQRRRQVYSFAALVAQQSVGNDSPSRAVVQHAKITAYAFAWANDDARPTDMDVPPARDGLRDAHFAKQEAVFRDLVGHLLQPVDFDPRWRTSDVVGIARGIYDDLAFERMPILADALMDAGCEDEQIIGHCRGHGPHVKGCWLVDLVLGNE